MVEKSAMEKKKSRLLKLITENLESKSAKGLENFKREVEREIIKNECTYDDYKRDREKHRLQAVKEINELRLKRNQILEKKLEAIHSKIDQIKQDTSEKQEMLQGEEYQRYKQLQDEAYTLSIRLENYLAEDWSNYGKEELLDDGWRETDGGSESKVSEDKSVYELVAQHLSLEDNQTAFESLEDPYEPVYNAAGELDPWDQPWFAKTFPQTLRRVFKETTREVLKRISREGLDDEDKTSSASSNG